MAVLLLQKVIWFMAPVLKKIIQEGGIPMVVASEVHDVTVPAKGFPNFLCRIPGKHSITVTGVVTD